MEIHRGLIFWVQFPDSYAMTSGIKCTGLGQYVCARTPESAALKAEKSYEGTNVVLGRKRLIQVHKFGCIW